MNQTQAIETRDDETIWIRVRVQPKASRETVTIEADGRIRVALCAPPVDGAANAALCAYFAKILGVSKTKVRVVKGEKSREKALAIHGLTAAEAFDKLGLKPANLPPTL